MAKPSICYVAPLILRRAAIRASIFLAGLASFAAPPAAADIPETSALLADFGLSQAEIAQVQSGGMVHYAVETASDRELTTGLAFELPVPPAELLAKIQSDLLDRVDPSVSGFGTVSEPGSLKDFDELVFHGDAQAQAKRFTTAKPGEDLNLSTEEMTAFDSLGSGAVSSAVEAQLRSALLARVRSYRTKGLDGIAPYARGNGETRSPADELRTASAAAKHLQKYAPSAYPLLTTYPNGKPSGTREAFRWSQFDAHGVPTVSLTHILIVPDGAATVVIQRQFYVSSGYNVEQAVVGLLPSKDGTVVIYNNRTSTDQVTGLGGGAKRSIGSKLLASQLESLFEKTSRALK